MDRFDVYSLHMVLPENWGCRDRMVVGFTITVQSVPITTKVMSLNHVQGEVYSIQHYEIKFVSDLRQA